MVKYISISENDAFFLASSLTMSRLDPLVALYSFYNCAKFSGLEGLELQFLFYYHIEDFYKQTADDDLAAKFKQNFIITG